MSGYETQMISEAWKTRFNSALNEVRDAHSITRSEKLQSLLSQIDAILRKRDGIDFLYDHVDDLLDIQVFADTPWQDADGLVPALVGGTLKTGFPNNVFEVLSEIRMVAIAEGSIKHKKVSPEQAMNYLEEVLVGNFELAFHGGTEETRHSLSKVEHERIQILFEFLISHLPFSSLKPKLAEEVSTHVQQRPIVNDKVEDILSLIKENVTLDGSDKGDLQLLGYIDALFHPTPLAKDQPYQKEYANALADLDEEALKLECKKMGSSLRETGLVSQHQVTLLRFVSETYPNLVPATLGLSAHGKADYKEHQEFVTQLIDQVISQDNRQTIYGLARLLDRNMLSRKPVWNAINKLLRIKLHPDIKHLLKHKLPKDSELDPVFLLVGGTINVLGSPLGIGQGNNPTCQSARGMSMWSQHAPGKLLNLIIDAATSNNLEFRYEGDLLQSRMLIKGTQERFDFDLDPVSIVLVPHLDKIYNEMMRRAMVKHVGQDPHVSVNPAFYGHWIQTGFISAYNALTGYITNYERFVRMFYASFHPDYNGGHHFIYPVPLGIFITSAKAEMVGYHAISLVRVDKDPRDEWRAYFFNPNNEGRQDWGQNIKPTVSNNGEMHGESSLPVHEFVSRVYAYHYNTIGIDDRVDDVPKREVNKVVKLAKASWGTKYIWS